MSRPNREPTTITARFRVSSQQCVGREGLRFQLEHAQRDESVTDQPAIPAESVRLHPGRADSNSETLQRKESALLHVELRRIQIPPGNYRFCDDHDAGDAERRLLRHTDRVAGPAFAHGTPPNVLTVPYPGNQVPQNRIDKTSLLLMKFFPLPNQPVLPGTPIRNYQYTVNTPIDKDQFNQRIDFNESAKSSVRPL